MLDPMCGSGTVLRLAAEAGFGCVGFDMDPLAVLMARVWSTPTDINCLRADAEEVVVEAKSLPADAVECTTDVETQRFISYWFAPRQELALRRLATVLRGNDNPSGNVLATALSRTIVSKEKMASLARDTSHSRPHRVADSNDFDVYSGFMRAVGHIARHLKPEMIRVPAEARLGDARILDGIEDEQFDLVLTSPPYLNAIDYLRGHRLALIWLGFDIGVLREIRATSIGAERIASEARAPIEISQFVKADGERDIDVRHQGWIRRYAFDMQAVLRQVKRTIKEDGVLVMVVGNSFLRGSLIDNAGLVQAIAELGGFRVRRRKSRQIPARRRYLPPPGTGRNALDARMRTETVLAFGIQ